MQAGYVSAWEGIALVAVGALLFVKADFVNEHYWLGPQPGVWLTCRIGGPAMCLLGLGMIAVAISS